MNNNTPNHIAFIVDGNRRWAKEKNLPTLEGHKKGLSLVEQAAEKCFEKGVKFATFFIFSTENWQRSQEEVSYLMKLVTLNVKRLAKNCLNNNIKIVILGTRNRLDPSVLKALDLAESTTKDCTKGTLGICFNYGGRQEIIDAANQIQSQGTEITEENLTANLYRPEIPDVDLLVRTSSEQRISGFMLWRAAYAELLFVKKYWPDITAADIDDIFAEYSRRNRRFGK